MLVKLENAVKRIFYCRIRKSFPDFTFRSSQFPFSVKNLNGSLCLHPVQPIFGTALERDPWRMVRYVYIAIRAALATL